MTEHGPTQADRLRRIRTLTLPPTAKLLLMTLDSYVEINGTNDVCWPSEETLAENVGISDRQVRRLLRVLENAGEVEKRIATSANGRYNVYRLLGGRQNGQQ